MTVDSIFICFCEDITENDGISKAYYMSPDLMNVMKKLKEEAGGDFNFGSSQQHVNPQPISQPYSSSQKNFLA